MRKKSLVWLSLLLLGGGTALDARPISAPLAVFESTKLPHRTLKDGPSIFGTLPWVNESNLSKEEKAQYQKMRQEVAQRKQKNEKYRRSKAKTLQLFESTKIHRDPALGPSPVREIFTQALGSVGLGDDHPKSGKKTEDKR
ncbi:hypothetical protein [Nitratifractor sp.]